MSLRVTPLTLKQANEYIASHHRHHKPVQGHRFSIGAVQDGELVGVCVWLVVLWLGAVIRIRRRKSLASLRMARGMRARFFTRRQPEPAWRWALRRFKHTSSHQSPGSPCALLVGLTRQTRPVGSGSTPQVHAGLINRQSRSSGGPRSSLEKRHR